MREVLKDVRVLNLGRFIAAPYAAFLLAAFGAQVIRVEDPSGAIDRQLGPFAPDGTALISGCTMFCNQKGITLNLRSEKGKEILTELVKRCDVLIENFSPEGKEALGINYESLSRINPKIIYVSASGFGLDGPYARRPCYDPIVQAMSGSMAYTGFPENPPTRPQVAFIDFATALHAAVGVLLALHHRERTGEGQQVDVAMFDIGICFVTMQGAAAEYKLSGHLRPQIGNDAFYTLGGAFETKDGLVYIAPVTRGLWRNFARLLGREDLATDAKFKDDMSRFQNRHLLRPIINEWMAQKTNEEVVKLLSEAHVPCGPVNTIAEAMDAPQVKARQSILQMEYPGVGTVPVPGTPIKLSKTPGKIERPAPSVGRDNEEIYCDLLGLTINDLTSLKEQGVI